MEFLMSCFWTGFLSLFLIAIIVVVWIAVFIVPVVLLDKKYDWDGFYVIGVSLLFLSVAVAFGIAECHF